MLPMLWNEPTHAECIVRATATGIKELIQRGDAFEKSWCRKEIAQRRGPKKRVSKRWVGSEEKRIKE